MGNTQTMERVLTVGENTPVMFTRGDDQYTGWELHLKAPENHKAQIGPPDSRGWSLENDEGMPTATVGCGIREHAKVIWLNSPDGDYPFHTRIEGVITSCPTTSGGGGGGGSGGVHRREKPTFSIEIIDGLIFLIEEESTTGVDTPVRIAAYRRQGSEYWSGEGETDWVPVEVDWSCDDNDLVFLESVLENDKHTPGEPLASDDMRQTSVWVKSSKEDTFTISANFEGTDSGSGNLPAQQLTAYVNVYDLALVVDANRDLKINHLDRRDENGDEVITADNPWRFWYNDDMDREGVDAVSEFNEPGKGTAEADFMNSVYFSGTGYNVNVGDPFLGTRDLTDFYALFVDIKNHVAKTSPGGDPQYTYTICIFNNDALYGTVVFTDLKPESSGDYLVNVEKAEEIGQHEPQRHVGVNQIAKNGGGCK